MTFIKNKITDFSVISKLKQLEYLSICYDDNLKKIDLSGLENLRDLKLENNPNLTVIHGIDELKLNSLSLVRNNITIPFDLPKLINNGLTVCTLDFDMFPILLDSYENLLSIIKEARDEDNFVCRWAENLSGIGFNYLSTYQIKQIDDKVKEILKRILNDTDTDIEKITAIYYYIISNIKYDKEFVQRKRNDSRFSSSISEKVEKAKQHDNNDYGYKTMYLGSNSSYNAVMNNLAVCEGYTNMMHYMLKVLGIESRTISCDIKPNKGIVASNSNHSIIRVNINGDWYYFDPTNDTNKTVLKRFFKTKEEIEKMVTLSISESNIKNPNEKISRDIINDALKANGHKIVIRYIEKLLNVKISPVQEEKKYDTNKEEEIVAKRLKSLPEINDEQLRFTNMLTYMLRNGTLNYNVYITLKEELVSEYKKMRKDIKSKQETTSTTNPPSDPLDDDGNKIEMTYGINPQDKEEPKETDKKKSSTDRKNKIEELKNANRKFTSVQYETKKQELGLNEDETKHLDDLFIQQQMLEQQRMMQQQSFEQYDEEEEEYGMSR